VAYDHCGDVLQLRVDVGRQVDAELLDHVGHRVAGELHLVLVAGAIEADHQTVADQLVAADALDIHQVHQRHGLRRQLPAQYKGGEEQLHGAQGASHWELPLKGGNSGDAKNRVSQPAELLSLSTPRPA